MITSNATASPECTEGERAFKVIAEFHGYVECPSLSGEADITVAQDELLVSTLFDQVVIPYSDVSFFIMEDYKIRVRASFGDVVLSRLGRNADWLFGKLSDAYNDAVLHALLVAGECQLQASGSFYAREPQREFGGTCSVRLFDDCLCLLPPNENARRLPLCFMTDMKREGHSLAIELATGEHYELSRMGRELDNVERQLRIGLRDLRERTAAWLWELAPSLSAGQASAAAKLMPLGTAACANELMNAAPDLYAALEAKARGGRMGSTYPWLKEFCGGSTFALGAKPAPPDMGQGEITVGAEPMMSSLLSTNSAAPDEDGEQVEEEPIVWMMAFNGKRALAAVELALPDGEASATYLYHVPDDWRTLARQIDRALEATEFQRALILLSDEELRKPENAQDAMLVKRTPALNLLRARLAGRAIHSSHQRWLSDIEKAASN